MKKRVRGFKKINEFSYKSCRFFDSYIGEGNITVWFGKEREDLLMVSKGEKFHKNLKRRVVRDLICLDIGRIILERKRILGKKC